MVLMYHVGKRVDMRGHGGSKSSDCCLPRPLLGVLRGFGVDSKRKDDEKEKFLDAKLSADVDVELLSMERGW